MRDDVTQVVTVSASPAPEDAPPPAPLVRAILMPQQDADNPAAISVQILAPDQVHLIGPNGGLVTLCGGVVKPPG